MENGAFSGSYQFRNREDYFICMYAGVCSSFLIKEGLN